MFCQNCGKEIPAGTNFCQYCGARIPVGQMAPYKEQIQQDPGMYSRQATGNISLRNFSIFEIAIVVCMVLIAVLWLAQAFANFEGTKLTADWLEGAEKVICLVLYWLPVALILALEVIGCIELLKKHYVISVGVILFLIAVVMKIGSWVCDDLSMEAGSMIAYRTFAPYGSIAGWTVLLSIVITAMLFTKANAHRKLM
ncbi:MAG: zinc ribbon domain-containing protein [Firmicutes bacterium]|nr:zinc ribbon domain-containing protein [Bacillota bacterium]